jgi:hypothetical protein
VLEDGARIFDLADSKYSVSAEYNKCLLHFWSAERNAVRRVLDAEFRNGNLRLMVQRLRQTRPAANFPRRSPVVPACPNPPNPPRHRPALPRPKIDWTLVGIDERWRDGVRAIFRKRASRQNPPRRHREAEEALSQRLCASE